MGPGVHPISERGGEAGHQTVLSPLPLSDILPPPVSPPPAADLSHPPSTGFVAGAQRSGRLWLRPHENPPPGLRCRCPAPARRDIRRRSRLHVRSTVRGGLQRERADSRSPDGTALVVRTDGRSALHACEHARHLRQHARACGDELGATDSLERTSPRGHPLGCSGRWRPAFRTLTPSRTTTSLAPAASFGAVVPAFGLFIRTLSWFQARREVVVGGIEI